MTSASPSLHTATSPWIPEGVANWRDVGGLPTRDGTRTRSRVLFRTDSLQDLSAADVDGITRHLGVRVVLDLRYETEAEQDGSGPLTATDVVHHNLPFLGYQGDPLSEPLPAGADEHLVRHYLSILDVSAPTVRRAVGLLAADEALPAIVHCAAGKDRTGILVALTLSAVGVTDEAVAADYGRTTPALPAILARLSRLPTYARYAEGVEPELNRTDPATMLAFLSELRLRFGSARDYLGSVGVAADELAALRDRLVEVA